MSVGFVKERAESAILAVGEAACTSSRVIDFVEEWFWPAVPPRPLTQPAEPNTSSPAHKPKITMQMLSVGWIGVKLTAIGLWSSGNAFSGVMNLASPPGSPTDESGFGGCQKNTTCPDA